MPSPDEIVSNIISMAGTDNVVSLNSRSAVIAFDKIQSSKLRNAINRVENSGEFPTVRFYSAFDRFERGAIQADDYKETGEAAEALYEIRKIIGQTRNMDL